MSEGTPIDAIESGDVPNAADAAIMKSILNEMNASGAEVNEDDHAPQQQQQHYQMPPQQMQQQMPPQFMNMQPQMSQMGLPPMPGNVPYQMQPAFQPINMGVEKRMKKRNIWSQIFDSIMDPLVVAVLIFVLSLPALHTVAGKYVTWAFAVGGQLSWLGLFAFSVLGGVIFGIYKTAMNVLG